LRIVSPYGGLRATRRSLSGIPRKSGKNARKTAAQVVRILRSTIEQFEGDTGLRPDDPVVVELKQILLRRIAELGPLIKAFNVPGTTIISLEGVPKKTKRKNE
jgi:hypothetical protein